MSVGKGPVAGMAQDIAVNEVKNEKDDFSSVRNAHDQGKTMWTEFSQGILRSGIARGRSRLLKMLLDRIELPTRASTVMIGFMLASFMTSAIAAEKVTYVYTDPQGTPLANTDEAGNVIARFDYAPYGRSVLDTEVGSPGYTGHENDNESGLVYMQARYYDPAIGRFLSVDPVEVQKGDVFSVNRFVYAQNAPLSHTDPSGKCIEDLCIGEAILVAEGIEYLIAATETTEVVVATTETASVAATATTATTATAATATTATAATGTTSVGGAATACLASFTCTGAVTLTGVATTETVKITLDANSTTQQQAEHTSGARNSTKGKHEKGRARNKTDKGGEKGDKNRRDNRKRPDGYKGKWPPEPPPSNS